VSTLVAETPAPRLTPLARSLSIPTNYVKLLAKAVRIVRHFV
jgi:hypothetical protein